MSAITKVQHLAVASDRPIQAKRETYIGQSALLTEAPTVGWSHFSRADAHLGAHYHRGCYEICYIVRGSVEWWAGSQIYRVGPRDVYITRPGETHGGVDAFMHPCELYWILVRPCNAFFKSLQRLEHRHFPGGPILADYFDRILAEHRLAQDGDGKKSTAKEVAMATVGARSALRLLVLDVLRFHQKAIERGSHAAQPSPPISNAMHWIHEHFGDDDCLEKAALHAKLRGTQFRKRFQNETGFAPHDYLVRAQVEAAKQRLIQGSDAITEIAFDMGFSTSQYFATVFRRLVGLTPQEYRKQHRVRTP
jgi:AraC-like DNA-binding protein/mannose-6-phosphate isomerase-like protein (cupin superfamily)